MNAKRYLVLASALILAWTQPNQSSAQTLEPFINNGLFTTGFPEVGLFFTGTGTCTATLIGCQTMLTAAHCVCSGPSAATCGTPATAGKFVFFQHNGLYNVSSISVNPSYNANAGLGNHDLAILRLAVPVVGIKPATLGASVALGTTVQMVGFGTAGPTLDPGTKGQGSAVTSQCGHAISTAICYDFEAPLGAPGTDSTACPGDSGGPMFAVQGGTSRLVGATSGGQGPGSATCSAPVQGVYTAVAPDLSWITSAAAGDLGQGHCGTLENAGSSASPITGGSGFIASGSDTLLLPVNVPAGTKTLFAALNASEYWSNDFDLYLNFGQPPSSNDFDCASELEGTSLERCIVQNPQAGTWYLLANRYSGSGVAQLAATSFSEIPTGGGCVPSSTTACVLGGRFKVEVQWTDFQSVTRNAFVASAGTSDTALFYWTNPNNWEFLIKGINGCGFNNKFWIYFAAATNVGYRVTVTDTQTGAAPKVYTNAVGNLAQATNDINAFSCP